MADSAPWLAQVDAAGSHVVPVLWLTNTDGDEKDEAGGVDLAQTVSAI